MSDDGNDDDYEVGYGKPPEEHRFKKGQSGNPGGRPPKRRRADVPNQLSKDVLEIAGEPVDIRTLMGKRRVSMQQAILFAIANGAVRGNPTCLRYWLDLYPAAVDKQFETYPMVRLVSMLLDIADNPHSKTEKETLVMLDAHIKAIEQKRRGN